MLSFLSLNTFVKAKENKALIKMTWLKSENELIPFLTFDQLTFVTNVIYNYKYKTKERVLLRKVSSSGIFFSNTETV